MKNIILTGASDGLGKEFALKCLKEKDINIINCIMQNKTKL